MSNIPAYPLAWPVSVPRTKPSARKHSAFAVRQWNDSLKELRKELSLLGATRETISTNQPVRKDGEPFAQTRNIEDPGVAVYFMLNGNQVCFPCDRWLSIAENFRAITLHIYSMRAQQRYGVGTAAQAFAGYKALPASTEENWWDVLQLRRELATRDDIQAAHRARVQGALLTLNGYSEFAALIEAEDVSALRRQDWERFLSAPMLTALTIRDANGAGALSLGSQVVMSNTPTTNLTFPGTTVHNGGILVPSPSGSGGNSLKVDSTEVVFGLGADFFGGPVTIHNYNLRAYDTAGVLRKMVVNADGTSTWVVV